MLVTDQDIIVVQYFSRKNKAAYDNSTNSEFQEHHC